MTKLFVGVKFSEKGLLSKKVSGFRKRFDPKYNQYSFPHMAMLAPFEIHDRDYDDLKETLKEELDTFFYDVKNSLNLAFNGVGVYKHKRKSLLYLNALYDADLTYCSEVVLDICKSFIPRSFRYKENSNQFIPLGYFIHEEELNEVMSHARLEFENNGEIPIESISLFEKRYGVWFEVETLVKFEESERTFLQLNRHSL